MQHPEIDDVSEEKPPVYGQDRHAHAPEDAPRKETVPGHAEDSVATPPAPTTPSAGTKPTGKPAPKPAATKVAEAKSRAAHPVARGRILRRKVVWWGVFGFLIVCVGATVRFFFPRAIFEPKTRFRIGYPSDYGFGVSTKWQAAQRIWVVRDSGGLYVIYAKCSHLGCTPDWNESENKFKCPCHGSGFDTEGVNFEGPAPRPLDRLHLAIDAEGQIVVDKSRIYGGLTLALARDAWKKEGAFLQV